MYINKGLGVVGLNGAGSVIGGGVFCWGMGVVKQLLLQCNKI